jgi:hypothetical protein
MVGFIELQVNWCTSFGPDLNDVDLERLLDQFTEHGGSLTVRIVIT